MKTAAESSYGKKFRGGCCGCIREGKKKKCTEKNLKVGSNIPILS